MQTLRTMRLGRNLLVLIKKSVQYSLQQPHRTQERSSEETDNPLYKHDQATYNDTATSKYEPIAFFRDPLTRLVNEPS